MTDDRSERGSPSIARRLLERSSWAESRRIADILRTETVGGALILLGAVLALAWANSPWGETYQAIREFVPWAGGSVLALDIDLADWASDGLLAIFFFVVGLELKREFVAGDLRDPARAALPVVAAIGGMVAPALFFVAINLNTGGDALRGWAIPTATDIAFALAVLAIIGSHLPSGLRAFLLTLAVVDDLFAISIIALFYTDDFNAILLLASLAPIAVFGLIVQRRKTWWWALIPLAVTAWTLMHASGVHATIAGVLLGFTVPVLAPDNQARDNQARDNQASKSQASDKDSGPAEHLEHVWRPVSAGFAVPVFAFFAAGVSLREDGILSVLADPVAIGVIAGLVLGKVVGVLGSTYLLARFTRAQLDENLSYGDLLGVSLLAGIGFTVSLLIGELAFGAESDRTNNVTAAVIAGSVLSAVLAAIVLSTRNRVYRRIHEEETRDSNLDGIPDVYQREGAGKLSVMSQDAGREADVDTDDAVANSRDTGGEAGADDADEASTTGTGESEEFVGRVSGQDDGGAGESGAEARANRE